MESDPRPCLMIRCSLLGQNVHSVPNLGWKAYSKLVTAQWNNCLRICNDITQALSAYIRFSPDIPNPNQHSTLQHHAAAVFRLVNIHLLLFVRGYDHRAATPQPLKLSVHGLTADVKPTTLCYTTTHCVNSFRQWEKPTTNLLNQTMRDNNLCVVHMSCAKFIISVWRKCKNVVLCNLSQRFPK